MRSRSWCSPRCCSRARNVVPALRYVAGLEPSAPDLERQVEDGKKQFAGVELPHRTLGIVGLGAIGSLVADIALKLGMKVIGFDPEITVEAAWRLPSSVRKAHSIEELLKQSDFVTLHVPLRRRDAPSDRRPRLAAMKPGAVLLNFARDGLVDEAAVRRGAALPAAQVLRLRFSERGAAGRAGRRSRCRTSAPRPRKRRRTAR